jgi:mRNA interferase RelE/StbE
MNYVIKISKSVQKQIDNLPNTVKDRILEKLKNLEIQTRPFGIVKLKNSEQ